MKVLYTALLALLLFPSCRRQSGDIDSFLHNAESLMNEHPEDALSIIRHIDRRKIYSSASEARYALLYSQALDKNYVDVTSDSLTAVAVNYYDRHGTKHERAMAHYYQGRVFSNAGNFDAAIRSYSLAEDAASGTDDYYLLGLINNAVGNLHFEQYDLDEALQRDQQAASFFHRAQSPYNEALAYIGVGTVYSLKGDNEQMEIVYNKAIEIYKELGEIDRILPLYEELVVKTQLNVGNNLRGVKNDLRRYYLEYSDGNIPLQSLGLWQGIYLKGNELDSAKMCGDLMLQNRNLFTAHKIAGCYALMEQIACMEGDYKEAYGYQAVCRYDGFGDTEKGGGSGVGVGTEIPQPNPEPVLREPQTAQRPAADHHWSGAPFLVVAAGRRSALPAQMARECGPEDARG